MNLRNKIAITNFCSVIIPLTVIFMVVFIKSGKLHPAKSEEFSSAEVIYHFEENVSKLTSTNVFSKTGENYISSSAVALTEELDSIGFHFKIFTEEAEFFNNLTEKETELISEFQENFLNENKDDRLIFFSRADGKNLIYKKTSSKEVIALYDPSHADKKSLNSVLPISFLNYGIIVIIVFSVALFVIFVSFLSNYWIQKSLLETKEKITCGKFTIYLSTMKVFVGGKEIELKRREFDLFAFLAIHRGEVFSKADLLENVWGMDSTANEPTVAVHINRLREKIEKTPENPRYLKTVWGKGYVFVPSL
ncbi:MAG: response regulator transcription factor [Treponema sp.]|uniref:winged helix-turn-helix domain-containing protein n=1 Tax=Treponema sp. TaxID=166 RepID=UPI0025D2CF86|nr:response regulator transcription factor [Treponema sp.]MBQ9282349.1 response regulator transcription factor [Treponema sp.]